MDGGKDGGMNDREREREKIQREREQIVERFEHPDECHKQGA